MRRVGGVATATAAALSLLVASASAGGEPPRGDEPRFLLFSTTDLWRHGGFVHGGAVWSPGGVDKEGFALKVMFGGGNYRYISGALNNTEVVGDCSRPPSCPVTTLCAASSSPRSTADWMCRTTARRRTIPRPDCVATMSDFASTRSFGTSRRRPPDRGGRHDLNHRYHLQRALCVRLEDTRPLLSGSGGAGLRARQLPHSASARTSPGSNTNGSSGRVRWAGQPIATTATVSTASLGC